MKLLVYRWEEKNGSNLLGTIEFPFESQTPITEDLLTPDQDDEDLRRLKGLVGPMAWIYSPSMECNVTPADGWDYLEALADTDGMLRCYIDVTKDDLKKYGIEDEDEEVEEGEGEPEATTPGSSKGYPDMDEFFETTHFVKLDKKTIMSDIAEARAVFREDGLAFPVLPKKFASSLRKLDVWLYSTRPLKHSPYAINYFLDEAATAQLDDYAALAHSGHGINSYAIQYFLVCGPLRMFLFLGWGGAYKRTQKCATQIKICFGLANKITKAAARNLRPDLPLTVLASDFYGCFWSTDKKKFKEGVWERLLGDIPHRSPEQVLSEVLEWLEDPARCPEAAGEMRGAYRPSPHK